MTYRTVIIGGGFGGLEVAKSLGNKKDFDVTLIDRKNYHLFQPLLYQVAMAGLSPAEIAIPIRSLLSKFKNIEVVFGEVEEIDLKRNLIKSDREDFHFDFLILACGASHYYFGHQEWEILAPGLKTLEQATEIRRRVLMAFELAEREKNSEIRKQLLTFAVIGGGPTGVELAGAIGEISRHTLARDFRHIKPGHAKVILLEGGSRILPSFHPTLSNRAEKYLTQLGVQVRNNSMVTNVTKEGVEIGPNLIKTRTALWAAGVRASSINQTLEMDLDKEGRVNVNTDLSLPDFPEVFVIGDQARFVHENNNPLPGLAPVAIQQGRFVGKTLLRQSKGKKRQNFCYRDKGQMATIGRKMAVIEFKGLRLSGTIAWVIWAIAHIYYLVGFKNRLFVLLQWAGSYFSYGRGARLIVPKEWRSNRTEK